jgi:hypothetical protein
VALVADLAGVYADDHADLRGAAGHLVFGRWVAARARLQEVRYVCGLILKPLQGVLRQTLLGKSISRLGHPAAVPVWYGFEVQRRFLERGTANYINPENFTSPAGLSYIGLSLPLAQGLLIDESDGPSKLRPRPLAGLSSSASRALASVAAAGRQRLGLEFELPPVESCAARTCCLVMSASAVR